jgi:hypothetical protein
MTTHPETRLGEYLLEGPATVTPNGQVFHARHSGLDRRVSITVFDQRLVAEPDFAERLSAALRSVAPLNHPHIAQIYDAGMHDGRSYIVGERLSGVTAATLAMRRAQAGKLLPLNAALDLARQAAEALAYAHALGVAHGSLSLASLHFDGSGPASGGPAATVKIAGWEQARLRTPSLASASDDVYHLGAIMYELCTGRPLDDVSGLPPLAPQVVRPGLPPSVAMLINQCLDHDPALRPGAAEVATRLTATLDEARTLVHSMPLAPLDLELTPKHAAGRGEAAYQVALSNTQNTPVRYRLSAESRDVLDISFVQDDVVLEPGQRAKVALMVRAPQRFVGSAQTNRFEVTARADNGASGTARGEFVHQALVAPWMLLAGALLVLLAVLATRGLLGGGRSDIVGPVPESTLTSTPTEEPTPTAAPGAPVVLLFSAEPQMVQPGQPVLVSWDVQGADRVVIEQFGDVPPSGRREHRPEQTTDYRLVATGGGQEATRIERVSVVAPTPEPTAAPTAEPPTAAPTAEPPTAQPTLVIPTAEPPPAAPVPVFLADTAPNARWAVDGRRIRFGGPAIGEERASANYASNAILEDGNSYASTLLTIPASEPASVLEGQFDLPAIGQGQHFLADIGFAQETSAGAVVIEVRFAGEVIVRETKQRSGSLLRIQVDLQRFVGRSGRLDLRVSAVEGAERAGIHWVNPRIDVVQPL